MNNKGKVGSGTVLLTAAVIAMISVVGLLAYFGVKMTQMTALPGVEELVPTTPIEAKVGTFCANNPDIDWEVRALDKQASTASYRSGYVYLVDKQNGQIVTEKAIGTITSTRSDLTDALGCGHEYAIWTATRQDGNYTAWETPISLSAADTSLGDPIVKDIKVDYANATLNIRCYDNLIAGWMYDADRGRNITTGYRVLTAGNTTSYMNFTSTTDASTNMALNTGDSFDVSCEIKTHAIDQRFGRNVLLGLDYSDDTDTSDWDDSEFALSWNGKSISELGICGASEEEAVTKNCVTSNDKTALTGYEYVYKLEGGITEDKTKLNIQGKAASTGTVDRDLVFRLCGTGTYLSNDDDTKLLHDVCFRDDGATRTEIATATARGFRFLID